MADLRERGTSFLTRLSSFAMRGPVIVLGIGASLGLAFGTLVSPIVVDTILSLGPVMPAADFLQLSVLRNPDTLAAAASLAAVEDAGISTPELGVIIAAMMSITASHYPGREGDQLQ